MMRIASAALLGTAVLWSGFATADDDEHGASPFAGQPLVMLMHNMQYYAHKLGLAIDAGNPALQGFYSHELEEVIEAVAAIDDYDGIAIGKLLRGNLEPAFEALEAAIDGGDPARISVGYDNLLEGCNTCHRSADRPYLVVERNPNNPYPQRFAPTAPAR